MKPQLTMRSQNPAADPARVIVVAELTREQMAIFAPAAKQARATVGELLVALACTRLNANPGSDDAICELESCLWSYATGRFAPNVHHEWSEAGFVKAEPQLDADEMGAAS